jgi:proline iminopeptidase
MPPIPAPRESGYTSSTPVPLYWVRYGDQAGTPLLVLHGGPGAEHDYLLPQMLALEAPGRDIIFYDQRGGGQSRTDDRTPITWRTQVDDLAQVIAELRITPLTLIGYSWGALLALLYMIEAAARGAGPTPVKAVLIDSAPVTRAHRDRFEAEFARRQGSPDIRALRDELAASGLRERDPEAYRNRAFELSVAGYFANPLRARDLTPFRVIGRVQESIWQSLGDYDLTAPGMLDSLNVTALFIHGRQDPIPLESSTRAAAEMRGRLVILEECGHVPYVEQPEKLFEAIDTFLLSSDPQTH